ncbi:MAG: rhodanese-like domain-containing protein [Acidimicrobiales bacterium]
MPYAEVTPEALRARLDSGEDLVVLDVREADEVAEWAFPGAVHIPLGELGARASELPVDRPIMVICHAGVRSAAAADALSKAGWNAQTLIGGAVAWVATEPEP